MLKKEIEKNKDVAQLKKYLNYLLYPEEQMIKEPKKKKYVRNETEYNLGDLVLVFPNPDHQKYDEPVKIITFERALHLYQATFPKVGESKKQIMLENAFKIAFMKLCKAQDAIVIQTQTNEKLIDPEKISLLGKRFLKQPIKKKNIGYNAVDLQGNPARINPQETRLFAGGRFLTFDYTANSWKRSGEPVRDFCTLFRIIILHKLVHMCGFHIRQFISENGQHIFVVLHTYEENLKQQAEEIGYQLRLSFAQHDLLSLEPIDSSYRPLRCHSWLLPTTQVPESMKPFREQARKNFREINFKNVSKEVGQMLAEIKSQIKFEAKVSMKTWRIYCYQYLQIINDGCQQIRQKYQYLKSVDTLTNQDLNEIKEISMKENSWKSQSKKDYVKNQVNKLNKKIIRLYNQKNRAKDYEELFKNALQEIKTKYKFKLHTIWSICGMDNQSPWASYHQEYYMAPFKWKQYIINEKGDKSIFFYQDRIKLTNMILGKFIKTSYPQQLDILLDVIGLNDKFELFGKPKTNLISALISSQHINPPPIECIPKGGLNNQNLYAVWNKFSFSWVAPVEELNNYFDLFNYIQTHQQFICFQVLYTHQYLFLGIPFFILFSTLNFHSFSYQVTLVLFSYFNVMWCSIFILKVKGEFQFLNSFYSQENQNESNDIRPIFEGKIIRSPVTNNMNSVLNNNSQILVRFLLNIIKIFFIVIFQITLISLMGWLIIELEKSNKLNENKFNGSLLISYLIFFIFTLIIEKIAYPLCYQLTIEENHRLVSVFETSYTIKIFIIRFLNILGPCFFLGFFADRIFGCYQDFCFQSLYHLLRIMFFFYFLKNGLLLIMPIFKYVFTKKKIFKIDISKSKSPVINNLYLQINQFIEREYEKENFNPKADISGTAQDYLNAIIEFGFICNFAIVFPLAAFLTFSNHLFKNFIQKKKLFYFTRRDISSSYLEPPYLIPMMDFLAYTSVFTNAGLIIFVYPNRNLLEEIEVGAFIFICLTQFFIQFIIQNFYSNKSWLQNQIFKRLELLSYQKEILKNKGSIKVEPAYPIYKLFGALDEKTSFLILQDRERIKFKDE